MVVADDREQPGAGAQRRDDGLADERMQVHRDLFVVVQGTGLEEDGVGDADLADVVDETAAKQRVELRRAIAEPDADRPRRLRYPLRVRLREGVFGLDGGREREDHLLGAVQRVVDALEPEGGGHAGDELDAVHRLGHVVIGSGLEGAHPVARVVQGGDHDHGQEA